MTTIRKKPIIRVELEGHCPTMSLTEVRVRKHSFVIDEPPYRHGTDVGPTPLETMLGALISCTNVISRRIAHEKNIDLKISRIRAASDTSTIAGSIWRLMCPSPFQRSNCTIEGTTNGTEDEMAALRRELKIRCPMSVILTQAGTIIEESWSLKQSPAEALSGSHA